MSTRWQTATVYRSNGYHVADAGSRLKDALERAFLCAAQPDVRYVWLRRTSRAGVSVVWATLVGRNGRVWASRNQFDVWAFAWGGAPPAGKVGVVELTGKYVVPTEYAI